MSEFFSSILKADDQILLFINGLNNSFLDAAMWQASSKFFWLPLYILLVAFVIKKFGIKKATVVFLIIALMILATDQLCASVVRPIFCRLRPSSPLNPISNLLHFVNDSRGGSFGFPSIHAANSFAVALFLSLLFKKGPVTISLFAWALLVSISRVYLGFHYPTDILAGALIGIGMAFCFYRCLVFLWNLRLSFQFKGFLR